MKHTINDRINNLHTVLAASCLAFVLTSCSTDDPQKEDVPELITRATLTFSPQGGGPTIVGTATDPDGEGVQDIEVDGPIDLKVGTTYTLALTLINELANPSDPEYNITDEVEEEGDEHMFFFSWTNNIFSDPAGNGNIDNRSDAVHYEDEDENGLPIGLTTEWTTTAGITSGSFRVVLKHQPALKSESSGASVGETDLDIEFTINIE